MVKNYQFEVAARIIASLFPGEDIETFYIPPKAEGPEQKISKGKLVEKYRNKRKFLKKNNALGSSVSTDNLQLESDATDVELDEKAAWLKHSSEPYSLCN